MRLASYLDQGHELLGLVEEDRVLRASDAGPEFPTTLGDLLDATNGDWAAIRRSANKARILIVERGRPLDEVALLPPVPHPSKIVAIGLNYRDHAVEAGAPTPTQPTMFAKFPSSLIGHRAEISWDPNLTTEVDYEAELAVVIGRRAKSVSEENALDYVFGYTCANDVSARDLQFAESQWVRGKSLDTFCPLGPVIVTSDEIPDPQSLEITCTVNGRQLQSANTSEMFFGVANLVSYCSLSFTLEPGDVIITGTPAGVGVFKKPKQMLRDGDEVVVEVGGIGRLVNLCRTNPRD
jgi:2-keto-4-pentenoate hydratase/2-oxohepta-3-ene-1,7-dioic acid hydratase in catechol pathway